MNHSGAGGGDEDGYDMSGLSATHRDVRNWAKANLSLGPVARAALWSYVDRQEQAEREAASLREKLDIAEGQWARESKAANDHYARTKELTAELEEARAKQRSAELGLELFQQSAAAVEQRNAELRDVFGQIADAVNENCDDLQPRDLLQLVIAMETERDALRDENKEQLAELRDLRMVFGYTDALLDELTESAISKLTAYAQRLVPKLRELVEAAQRPAESAPVPGCPTQGCIYMGGHNGPCFREGDVVPAVVYVGPSPAERAPVLSYEELMDAMGDEIERHPLGGHGRGTKTAPAEKTGTRPPSCRHVRPPRRSIAEPHCVLPAGHDGDHAAMSVDDVPAGPRWAATAETGIMSGHGHWGAVGTDLHRCNWVSGYGNRCTLPHPHDGAHATAPLTAQRADDFVTRAELAAIINKTIQAVVTMDPGVFAAGLACELEKAR